MKSQWYRNEIILKNEIESWIIAKMRKNPFIRCCIIVFRWIEKVFHRMIDRKMATISIGKWEERQVRTAAKQKSRAKKERKKERKKEGKKEAKRETRARETQRRRRRRRRHLASSLKLPGGGVPSGTKKTKKRRRRRCALRSRGSPERRRFNDRRRFFWFAWSETRTIIRFVVCFFWVPSTLLDETSQFLFFSGWIWFFFRTVEEKWTIFFAFILLVKNEVLFSFGSQEFWSLTLCQGLFQKKTKGLKDSFPKKNDRQWLIDPFDQSKTTPLSISE